METVAFRAQKRDGLEGDAIKEEHVIRPKGRGSHDPRVAMWFRQVIKGKIKGWMINDKREVVRAIKN